MQLGLGLGITNHRSRAGAVAGGISSTQWRLSFPLGDLGWGNMEVAEVEMRAAAGGPDQCNGGTASASAQYSAAYSAANAFNNTPTGNAWGLPDAGVNSWLQYTFASAVSVAQIAVTGSAGAPNASPEKIVLEYYNGSTWVPVFTSSSPLSWTAGETKIFTV